MIPFSRPLTVSQEAVSAATRDAYCLTAYQTHNLTLNLTRLIPIPMRLRGADVCEQCFPLLCLVFFISQASRVIRSYIQITSYVLLQLH